jgi:2'-5' RNA ligase
VARLFVALHPEPAQARRLLAALPALELPPHRPTPEEQVHLTLAFLGEVDERQVEAAAESVERGAAGVRAFELAVQGLAILPEGGPARLVAALTDGPAALLELQRRLASRLLPKPRRPQRFLPHLTLARFPAPLALELPPAPGPWPVLAVTSIALMRSRLRPEGSEHRQVLRVPLAGP